MLRAAGIACSAAAAYSLPAALAYSRGAGLLGVHRRLRCTRAIAMTFDDGPQPDATERFARLLHDADVQATFFMVGERVRRYPSLVQEVLSAGHAVANHGYRHQNHLLRNPSGIWADMRAGAETLAEVTGLWPRLFRPPQGVVTALTRYAAWREQSSIVLWDAWGRDWRPQATRESIVHDVLRDARGGSIVLLHDGDSYGGRTWHATYAAVPEIIADLRGRGLQITRLSDRDQLVGDES